MLTSASLTLTSLWKTGLELACLHWLSQSTPRLEGFPPPPENTLTPRRAEMPSNPHSEFTQGRRRDIRLTGRIREEGKWKDNKGNWGEEKSLRWRKTTFTLQVLMLFGFCLFVCLFFAEIQYSATTISLNRPVSWSDPDAQRKDMTSPKHMTCLWKLNWMLYVSERVFQFLRCYAILVNQFNPFVISQRASVLNPTGGCPCLWLPSSPVTTPMSQCHCDSLLFPLISSINCVSHAAFLSVYFWTSAVRSPDWTFLVCHTCDTTIQTEVTVIGCEPE